MHDPRPGRRTTSVVVALALAVGTLLLSGIGPATASSPDYTWNGARWNPCQRITFRIGGTAPYRDANRQVRQAFHRMGVASGIRFVYAGRTRHRAWSQRPVGWDVTVTWATPRQFPGVAGRVAGKGGYRALSDGGPFEIVDGQLVLDRTAHLRPGFHRQGPADWGQVTMHEIGHVLGLGHARGPRELMYPVATERNHQLAAGDRAGLRRVGRPAGCIRHSLR